MVEAQAQHRKLLLDHDTNLGTRMRAIFELRTINDKDSRQTLVEALIDKSNSTLLRHEVAFALGQMQEDDVSDSLIKLLLQFDEDIIVRHECAEALGAIGALQASNALETCAKRKEECSEVRETCELALARLSKINNESKQDVNDFKTIDPVTSQLADQKLSISQLENIVLDENEHLGKRYRAMFTLRDKKTDNACLALAKGLFEKSSALFRHEVAFVLGQLENPVSFDALKKCLENTKEHDMVRHECAEALGTIDKPEATELLRKYSSDPSQIVRESCEVALDARKYWEEFSK